jgi:ribosomal protein S18 acetylase RimI-like enzyme
MWVDPTARRQGIGRALLSRAIDWAAAHDALHVELTVTEGNAAAQDMYVRAGFVDTGKREPLRPGSPLQTLYMRREVRA